MGDGEVGQRAEGSMIGSGDAAGGFDDWLWGRRGRARVGTPFWQLVRFTCR